MVFKKLHNFFSFKRVKTGRKLFVNSENLEKRVALLRDGKLEEFEIERSEEKNIVGNIYKGVVQNIEHGLKAVFIDIGLEKNAFLHFWDLLPVALDGELESFKKKGHRHQHKKITVKDIPELYPIGSEVMVQVTKGAISNKGPRISTNVSLAGRYLVLMPFDERCGISRKIENHKERKRLTKILQNLTLPEGMGIIMRTISSGMRVRNFVRDIASLLKSWKEIEENFKSQKAPSLLHEESGLIDKTVRDFLSEDLDEIICDRKEEFEYMQMLTESISKRAKKKISLYTGKFPMFENLGIQKQIDNAFVNQVWLDCGGYIVIDETEALISIDINTGRNKGGTRLEETILQTNIEAAREIARQLRLRNIGGLIVVDFIDMKSRRDQNIVFREIKEQLTHDKAKTQVLPISALGLLEMTRQRLQESINFSLYKDCPYCRGSGDVKSEISMSIEIQRKLHAILEKYVERVQDYLIIIHPEILNRLKSKDDQILVHFERKYSCKLTFRSDPTYHMEQFNICDGKSGDPLFL